MCILPSRTPHLPQVGAQATPVVAERQAECPDGNLKVMNSLREGGAEAKLVTSGTSATTEPPLIRNLASKGTSTQS